MRGFNRTVVVVVVVGVVVVDVVDVMIGFRGGSRTLDLREVEEMSERAEESRMEGEVGEVDRAWALEKLPLVFRDRILEGGMELVVAEERVRLKVPVRRSSPVPREESAASPDWFRAGEPAVQVKLAGGGWPGSLASSTVFRGLDHPTCACLQWAGLMDGSRLERNLMVSRTVGHEKRKKGKKDEMDLSMVILVLE